MKIQNLANMWRAFKAAFLLLCPAMVLWAWSASAQTTVLVKTNNTDSLNLATSWTNDVVPGPANILQWDQTVSDINNTTNILGSDLSVAGLQVLNPAGAIVVETNSGGNLLTLGESGINLSTATVGLTLDNAVEIAPDSVQTWSSANGQTLSLGGPFTRGANSALYFNLPNGTVNIAKGTTNSVLYYSTINGTDVGGLNSSLDVVGASTVVSGGYSANPLAGNPATGYVDMINGNTGTTPDVTLNNTFYLSLIRFNQPQPNRNNWIYSTAGKVQYLNSSAVILVTTNVGAQNITIAGTYNTLRWNSGSELVLAQENPLGTLYVTGPTSERINTTANTLTKYGVGRVIFDVGFPQHGGTYVLEGELDLDGSAVAQVTVENGALFRCNGVLQGPLNIQSGGVVSPGNENAVGVLIVTNSATFQAQSGLQFYSGVDPATNTTALMKLDEALSVNGPVGVSIAAGSISVGQYPLLQWTNSLSQTVFTNFYLAAMPLRTQGYLSNNVANDSLDLVVTNVNEPIVWAIGNGTWDIGLSTDWVDTFSQPTVYQQVGNEADAVMFNDSASGTSPITISVNTNLSPAAVTFNASKDYVLSGTGSVGGNGVLTMAGSGTLTITTSNSYAGGTAMNGGTLLFSALDNLGSGSISFGGGTLQYSGNTDDISARTVTFNNGGGTINDGGSALVFAYPVGNGGLGGLTKAGSGSLTLNGTNNYHGNTIVSQGTLALAANTILPESGAIIVQSGAVLDTGTSGVNLTLSSSANQILAGQGTVTGIVTVPAGTSLTPGTNGTFGALNLAGGLVLSGGTLTMDVSTTNVDQLVVTGNLTINSGSLIVLNTSTPLTNGAYTLIRYTGSLTGGAASVGNLAVDFSQSGKSVTLDGSVAGEINLVVSDKANDVLTWAGTGSTWDLAGTADWLNGAAAWAFTNGDAITFDNLGVAVPTVNLEAALSPGSVVVSNDAATYDLIDGTGTGAGKISGNTGIVKNGAGTLIIETANNNTGPTAVQQGTLQVGNGAGGDLGTGNVTNNGSLVLGQGDGNTHTVSGLISGAGSVTVQGNATRVFAGNETYSGATTISAGTLQLGTGGGAGSLASPGITNNGSLVLDRTGIWALTNVVSGAGSLTLNAGQVTMAGNNSYAGGTLVNTGKLIMATDSSEGAGGLLSVAATGTNDLSGHNLAVSGLQSGYLAGGEIVDNGATGTNYLIDNAPSNYDSSIVIKDNDGTGGVVCFVMSGAGNQIVRGASTYTGGTLVSNGVLQARATGAMGTGTVYLRGGNLSLGANITVANPIEADVTGALLTASTANIYFQGPFISSTNIIMNMSGNETWSLNGAANQLAGLTGTLSLQGGTGYLRFFGSTGSDVTTFDMTGGTDFIESRGAGTYDLGALVGDSGGTVGGAAGSVYVIGGKNTDCVFSGSILNAISLVKEGTGSLTLNGGLYANVTLDANLNLVTNYIYTNFLAYTGTTSISNGILSIAKSASLTNSQGISLESSTAILDVSQMGTPDSTGTNLVNVGLFEVYTNQTLSGLGAIWASNVLVDVGAVLNPGLPTGILTTTNSFEMAGEVKIGLSRTNTINCGELSAPKFVVDPTATLVVTNVGGALYNGDQFRLFNQAVNPALFAAVTLPPTDATGTNAYTWQNNLSVDGTITLISGGLSPINPNPPVLVSSFAGGVLSLSWPTNAGWTLQMQTNTLAIGIGTNWVTVPGSSGITSTNIVVNPGSPAVFYRLTLP